MSRNVCCHGEPGWCFHCDPDNGENNWYHGGDRTSGGWLSAERLLAAHEREVDAFLDRMEAEYPERYAEACRVSGVVLSARQMKTRAKTEIPCGIDFDGRVRSR
jgi:hypothetical protein